MRGWATFPVPVYSGKVILCTNRAAYTKHHKELYGHDYKHLAQVKGLSGRVYAKGDKTVYLIGVFEGGDGTLVHELVHTVFEMLTYSGVPVSKKNDEAFAYLMDALFVASKEAMRKARK